VDTKKSSGSRRVGGDSYDMLDPHVRGNIYDMLDPHVIEERPFSPRVDWIQYVVGARFPPRLHFSHFSHFSHSLHSHFSHFFLSLRSASLLTL
jgi:hypothetical protein